jgi:hypothetical protein
MRFRGRKEVVVPSDIIELMSSNKMFWSLRPPTLNNARIFVKSTKTDERS